MKSQQVLVINCGSSSIKFAVLSPQEGRVSLQGLVECLHTAEARLSWRGAKDVKGQQALPAVGHSEALQAVLQLAQSQGIAPSELMGIGHRVVHGGEFFRTATLITDHSLAQIQSLTPLAPLHNPANVNGITAAQQQFPELPHVAVFDTAFHATMPPAAYYYAVPQEWYRNHGVRRYGFHGTSHQYVSQQAAKLLQRAPEQVQLVTAHLGNGCSVCAVQEGRSVDTSMGFTPLEGLVMGTRSGDLDPSILAYISGKTGCDLAEMMRQLNTASGLLGLSESSQDMRRLQELADQDNSQAQLAIDVFCHRLAKYIAAMASQLTRLDALVFTGGIGEHAAPIRAQVLQRLSLFGFSCDPARNAATVGGQSGLITTAESTKAFVIPTNEEWMIAQETRAVVAQQ